MIEWFDNSILDWFLSLRGPVLTAIMKFLSMIGEGGAIWIIIGTLLLIRRETRKMGFTVLLALLFCLLTGNLFLKNIVARPRPCWRNPSIPILLGVPQDYSFPSGHTMASFAAVTCLFLHHKRAGVLSAVAGMMIAASRMYFYVHYPTDILAGLLLGIFMGMVSWYIVKRFDSWRKYVRGEEHQKKLRKSTGT